MKVPRLDRILLFKWIIWLIRLPFLFIFSIPAIIFLSVMIIITKEIERGVEIFLDLAKEYKWPKSSRR